MQWRRVLKWSHAFMLLVGLLAGLQYHLLFPQQPASATAQRARPRLLYMMPSYTLDQYLSLSKSIDSLRDICNAGWDVTVHLQVANGLNETSSSAYKELKNRMYCAKSNSFMPFIVEGYDKIGFGLNSRHRVYMNEHIDEFDYFAYAEEDMIFTISHLNSYIEAMKVLKLTFPKMWARYVVGFLRYEDNVEYNQRVTWEYSLDQIHLARVSPTLAPYIVTNNLNQAIFLFSKDHLRDLHEKCNYLTDIGNNLFYKALRKALNSDWKRLPVGVSEWSSSFQHVLQCGVRRVIPTRNFQSFLIFHSTNKARGRVDRRSHVSVSDWVDLIKERMQASIISIEDAYNKIIFEQYNLHLLDKESLANKWGTSKWHWGTEYESPSLVS